MAKVINPLLSFSASGQIGKSLVFTKNGRVREYVVPANPKTAGQMAVRNMMGDIQRELKLLGSVLRAELRSSLGAQWNSAIVGELTANDKAAYTAYLAEYNAFTTQQKADWATADTATPILAVKGALLYAAASAIYDMALRMGVSVSITLPAAGNHSTVAAEWVDSTP